jgi:hypothetical protein
VLRTFAVARIVIVTGRGPQEKVITPPALTAATTALDVQLAAVPWPTTRVGCEVSAARAAGGTKAWPAGLPAVPCRASGACVRLRAGLRRKAGRPAGLGSRVAGRAAGTPDCTRAAST